jgi:hypothetical protein
MGTETPSPLVRASGAVLLVALALSLPALWHTVLFRLHLEQPLTLAGGLVALFGLVVAASALARRVPPARRLAPERGLAALDATGLGFVGLLLVLVCLFHWGYDRAGSDGREYFVQLRSLVIDGDLDFANENATFGTRGTARRYAFGAPLLWVPFYLACHAWLAVLNLFGGAHPLDGYGGPYQRAVGFGTLLYGFVALVLIYRMLRDYFSRRLSWITLVSLCFGSFVVWYLTVENSMVHGVSMFATTLFFFVWHHARRDPRAAAWARVGAAAGLMTMVRWQNGVFLLLPALQMTHQVWTDTAGDTVARGTEVVKRGAALAVAGGLTFFPQLLFWKLVYGEWWHLPSKEHGVRWFEPHVGDVLFSSNHGLLSLTPVIYLALLGLPFFIRRDRWLAAALAVGFVAQLYVNSTVEVWWGGAGFGGRRFANCALVFAVGLASLLEWVRRRPLAAPVCVLAVLLAMNTAAMADVRGGRWAPTEALTFDAMVSALYERVGNPFSFPMNAAVAWRYGVDLPFYDRIRGRTYNNLEIDIGSPGDERFLGPGWSVPEQHPQFTYRWADALESSIVVPLVASDDYRFEIQCGPFGYPGASQQTVTVIVNGHVTGTLELGGGLPIYELEVPAAFIRPNLNRIQLRYRYAMSPETAGLSADARTLAVQVSLVRLTRLLRHVDP